MDMKKITLCVLEAITVNIIIYYFFYRIPPNQELYLNLNPHPLFLLCIIMGTRYGNYLGIITALISTIFYAGVFICIHGDILLLFAYFRHYKYILLFFWTAMIFGLFKDNHKVNMQKIMNEKNMIKNDYDQLNKSHHSLLKALEELKKQIVTSEESILHLYEIASRLGTLNVEEIFTETMGILAKYLKARALSIYIYDKESGYMRLKISMGGAIIKNRSLLVKNSRGYSKVVLNKQAVRWADVKEDGFPLMAAPLIKDGQTVAIVNVEDMDFDHLSEYAYQLFKIIIEWVNNEFEKAAYVDYLSDSKYIDGTNVMKFSAFFERLESEERRKREFGMEFSVLQYKVRPKNRGLDDIFIVVAKILRAVDIISYDEETNTLYILLPATPSNMIYLVEERIMRELNDRLERINKSNHQEEKVVG